MAASESAIWAHKKHALVRSVRAHTDERGNVVWAPVVADLGMPATACRLKWRDLKSQADALGQTVEETLGKPPAQAAKRKAAEEFDIDELAPVVLPAPKARPTAKADTSITLIAGDFHFGQDTNSPECEDILISVVKDLQPGTIVLNGDLPDLMAVSRFPKDYRTHSSLTVEKRQMHQFFHRLMEASPKSTLIETNANHSGNGIESRWSRYLSERIPEIMDDPECQEKFSYQSIFYPKWLKIDLVDIYTVCPGLVALHGDIVRSHGAYSARGMLEKWRVSLIHGHTHRFGQHGYRVPAVAGKREHQMRAWEGGCCCRLTVPYAAMTNWQQGFSIVRHDEEGLFGVEQVLIHEGAAVCTTTGTRYKAAA
jgi:hypothetical protein